MTSICNYSHPEQQITTGLTRQTSGTLFPYNPEFYTLASGLYGPGTIYCWYLLLASVIINWSFHPKNDEGYRRPGVSNDLLAALAYPSFAATDVLIHGFKFLGTDSRALALFCLRYPEVELTGFGPFNSTQLNLNNIPPEVVRLGQRSIDLSGPLAVSYTFMDVMLVGLLLDYFFMEELHWEPTKWAKRLVYGTYAYVVLLMTIFHLSLGDLGPSLVLSFYEATMPFLFFGMFVACLIIIIAISWAIGMLIAALWKRDRKKIGEGLKVLLACIVFASIAGIMVLIIVINRIPLVPDIGVSLRERDQVAALLGGITTVSFTVGHLLRRYFEERRKKKGDAEELQTLASRSCTLKMLPAIQTMSSQG